MRLIRPLFGFTLVVGLGACLDNPGPVGTRTPATGSFVLTIDEFGTGPTHGAAQFTVERIDNVSNVSFSLTDSLGFSLSLSGAGTVSPDQEREIGEAEGMIGGTMTRRNGAIVERYVLTDGTLFVRGASATVILGEITFTARQIEGPAIGSIVDGTGNFRATGGNIQL